MGRHHHSRDRDRSDEDGNDASRENRRRHGGRSKEKKRDFSTTYRQEKPRKEESKEERLLRKAKEYVAKNEGRGDKTHHRDTKHRSSTSTNRRSATTSKIRKDDHEDRNEQRKRKHTSDSSKSRSRGRYSDDDDDNNDDDNHHSEKKHHRRESSSSRKRHKNAKDSSHAKKSTSKSSSKKKSSDRKEKSSDRKEKKKRSKSTAPVIHTKRDDLFPLGNIVGSPPERLLEDSDYFAYHQHLWVYLYREEGKCFNDLTSEEAREAFARFSKQYNDGNKLEAAYYDPKGLPSEAIDQCKTTQHAWSFKTSETEEQRLKLLQDGVRRQTEYDEKQQGQQKAVAVAEQQSGRKNDASLTKQQHASPHQKEEEDRRRRKTPQELAEDRKANRRLREHIRTAEEELGGGRKEGRERQIEKRKEKGAILHGAAREREEAAMGGIELDDKDIYGGDGGRGDRSFQDALARGKHRKAQREEKRTARVTELQEKENARQEAMLKMLGLAGVKPGQKITIAPRKDG